MRTLLFSLFLLLPTAAVAGVPLTFEPAALQRGTSTEVIVRTTGLSSVDRVEISGGDLLVSDIIATEELLAFQVGTGAQAAIGPRDINIYAGDALLFSDVGALEVVAGRVELLTLDPSLSARGETLTIAVTGTNLDTVESFDFGAGITTSGWAASSPTRGSLQVTVGGEAFSGFRDVVANTASDSATLDAAFQVVGGSLDLGAIVPGSAERGETAEVRIEGENLDTVTNVRFGPRVSVASFEARSPQELVATIEVRRDASAGPRAVELERADGAVSFEDVFTIRRGAIEVLEVRPSALRQGDTTFLTIAGNNLDGLTDVDAGEGIAVTTITATNPTSASVDIEVALDAVVGLRDIRIEGPAGELTIADALTVAPYVRPQPDLRFASEIQIEEVMIGGSGRSGLSIDNQGSLEETFTIEGSEGDLDQFFLVDADGQLRESLSVTVAPGELVIVPVWFVPELRGLRGARFVFTWEDPQVEAEYSFDVFGTGTTNDLLFSEESPYAIESVEAGAGVVLPRVFTRLRDGVPGRQVIIVGSELLLRRDGEVVEANPVIELFSTSNELYWGLTEVDWSLDLDAGSYDGLLTLETDNPSARYRDLAFTLVVEPGEEADAGGTDAGGTDAGSDAGETDAGDTDAGTDAGGADASAPDAGAPDTAEGDAGAPEDTGTSDDAGAADAGDNDGGGSGGGCAVAAGPSAGLWLLALMGALGRRRRRV